MLLTYLKQFNETHSSFNLTKTEILLVKHLQCILAISSIPHRRKLPRNESLVIVLDYPATANVGRSKKCICQFDHHASTVVLTQFCFSSPFWFLPFGHNEKSLLTFKKGVRDNAEPPWFFILKRKRSIVDFLVPHSIYQGRAYFRQIGISKYFSHIYHLGISCCFLKFLFQANYIQ